MSKHNKNRGKKQNLKSHPSKKQGKYFEMITPDAAGIDIGSQEHWVAVPEDRDEQPVRRFGSFTSDLHEIVDWLKKCKIKTVAMESTGVYWIPLFELLASEGFEVKLVNAAHTKNVTGRKSDVSDCQWIQQLHSYGLLQGSFHPQDEIAILRQYWRHRENLVRYAAAHIQHMQKAFTQMNLQLHHVISDITGVTGMSIIKAILAGERDPQKLAQLKDRRILNPTEIIAKSLEGNYRQEHLFALEQALEAYEFYQKQIQTCDKQIEQYMNQIQSAIDLEKFPLPPAPKGKRKIQGNAPKFDLRSHLYRICGVDYTTIPGIDALTVQKIISEVGLDHTAFPSEKHFGSWMGLCPENRITGGKVKSSKTRKVVSRAANAFRMVAQTLANSASSLGAFYRRMRARKGPAKAITATAYKLARIFYQMWKTKKPYQDLGADYYEQQYKERTLKNLKRKAALLGYNIVLQPIEEAL